MTLKLNPETIKDNLQKAKKAKKAKKADNDATPEIEITTQEWKVNNAAVMALAKDDGIYQRQGLLVSVIPDSGEIRTLPTAMLREALSARAVFVRRTHDKDGQEQTRPAHPPDWCIRAVEAKGFWPGIKSLTGIAEFPVLLPNGDVLSKPGYHAESGIYSLFKESVAIPSHPNQLDAKRAMKRLLNVLYDFPFADDSGRAAWFAALLSPIAKFAYQGVTPLFLADANTRGSGKGLLIHAIHAILTGRQAGAVSYPDSTEERRKLAMSVAITGKQFVFLDNLRGKFGDAVIDSILTTPTWEDRLMHSQRMLVLPLQAIWYATGNNLSLAADTGRRVCPMRLESALEHPEMREGFKHENLIAWVIDNRLALLADAVLILRAYCACGRPDVTIQAWGSFEGWSKLVRQAVVWVGLPDPATACRTIAIQADGESQDVGGVLEIWELADPANEGFTTKQLLEDPAEFNGDLMRLRDALKELMPRYDTRSLGALLKRYRKRIIGGRYVDFSRVNGRSVWRVYDAKQFST